MAAPMRTSEGAKDVRALRGLECLGMVCQTAWVPTCGAVGWDIGGLDDQEVTGDHKRQLGV